METAINSIRSSQITRKETPESLCPIREADRPCIFSGMVSRTGISSYWRKNTSSIESAELANLLRALRKVAGHLGVNTGRIEYTGMSTACENAIQIEPEMVMGRYPIPGEKVDYLVGMVVHEAIHRIEWTDHVWKILEPVMAQMSPLAKVIFQKIVRTGEDIFVDQKANQTVFGLYTKSVRDKWQLAQRKIFATNALSVDELILNWLSVAFDSILDCHIRSEYDPVLDELHPVNSGLKSLAKNSISVIKRCEKRATLYLDAWQKIEHQMIGWKIFNKHLCWFSSAPDLKVDKQNVHCRNQRKQKKLTLLQIREIETYLAVGAVDMTPVIRSVVGYDNETIAPMSRWDFNIASHPVIDRKMIGRLKTIFAHYADRNFLVSRGLSSGKIDRRRLFRAYVNGRCFKSIDSIPNLDWSVALLIDASGSMRGNKWQMVENTVANIHKALTGYRNRLSAWAYFEVNGICMISRLIEKNMLFSVPPSGQTASGQAIIAAAKMMPVNIKRNILIHITDGESNFGCDVSFGIEYCRQQKIHLITLGCGYKNKEAMKNQYGRTIQFIDYFEQLPMAMESLFKWAFLYGGRRSCPVVLS